MRIETYTAIVDTCILLLLLVWSWMDRNNIYISEKELKDPYATKDKK
jgi:hypothetical protein